ncbi:hypothetical protein VTK56DRAFT_502 [Thermocarpiscus australiensis]
MHLVLKALAACLAVTAVALCQFETPSPVSVSGCAAAVSTTDICTTCVTADCVILATVTISCGCPDPPATIFRSHPCDRGCSGLGCATVYTVVTSSGSACFATSAPGPTTQSESRTPVPPSQPIPSVTPASTNAAGRLTPPRLW